MELARKQSIPEYGTVTLRGVEVYRTRIVDADGKRVALYGNTRKELHEKVIEAQKRLRKLNSAEVLRPLRSIASVGC